MVIMSLIEDAGDSPFSGWKVGTGLVVMGFGIFVIVHFVIIIHAFPKTMIVIIHGFLFNKVS